MILPAPTQVGTSRSTSAVSEEKQQGSDSQVSGSGGSKDFLSLTKASVSRVRADWSSGFRAVRYDCRQATFDESGIEATSTNSSASVAIPSSSVSSSSSSTNGQTNGATESESKHIHEKKQNASRPEDIQLEELGADGKKKAIVGPPAPKFQALLLRNRSDEAIQAIYIVEETAPYNKAGIIKPGTILAVVGSLSITIFPDIRRSTSPLRMDFRRPFTMGTTYVSQHKNYVTLFTPGDPGSSVLLDSTMQMQFPLNKLEIPTTAVPVFFNGQTIAWCAPTQAFRVEGAKAGAVVTDSSNVKLVTFSVMLLKVFLAQSQVLTHFIYYTQDKSVHSHQITGDNIVTVLHGNKIQVHKMFSQSQWGDPSKTVADHLEISRQMRIRKFVAHKEGQILTILADDKGDSVITIATDKKIKLWYKSTLVAKFVNIGGSFNHPFPVVMRRYGNMLVYTANDGVYALRIPFPIETSSGIMSFSPEIVARGE